jgi:hypothetical protein
MFDFVICLDCHKRKRTTKVLIRIEIFQRRLRVQKFFGVIGYFG